MTNGGRDMDSKKQATMRRCAGAGGWMSAEKENAGECELI